MKHEFLEKAFAWVEHPSGEGFLGDEEYCATRDIFQAKLEKIRLVLEQKNAVHTPLLIAIIGEVGNNAYDHNLGNWRNVPGVYFAFDAARAAIIADRGQGVRKTLLRVESGLKTDTEALELAFTKVISGRTPERRGNGLKFVREVVQTQKWNLEFYSGTGKAIITKGGEMEFSQEAREVKGCIVLMSL